MAVHWSCTLVHQPRWNANIGHVPGLFSFFFLAILKKCIFLPSFILYLVHAPVIVWFIFFFFFFGLSISRKRIAQSDTQIYDKSFLMNDHTVIVCLLKKLSNHKVKMVSVYICMNNSGWKSWESPENQLLQRWYVQILSSI